MKNLFIVGAQRSGSTYLHKILDCHPQIQMNNPVRPEPKFFLEKNFLEKGKSFYEKNFFINDKSNIRYLGEKSTSYFEKIEAAKNIKKLYPDSRILIILRDPVQRAYSNYRFSVSNNLENLSFKDALAAEPERLKSLDFSCSVSPFAYAQRGHYINYLQYYLDTFDKKQIYILIFEEFVNNKENIQLLYRWLGVDHDFFPSSIDKIINPNESERTDQNISFRELVREYQNSISKLEILLDRKIDVWHKHHREIITGMAT